VPLANTWNLKYWQISLNFILKFSKKYRNTVTLLLAYFRLFLNNVQIDFDCNSKIWKKRWLTLLVGYMYSRINRITKLKFNKKSVELWKIKKTSSGFPRHIDLFNQGKKVA
jgi:hypothetical protein